MLKNDTATLHKKEAVLMACIDALAPLLTIDFSNEDARHARNEAIELLTTYPEIDALKRKVLKGDTPDHYACKAYNLLIGLSATDNVPPAAHYTINKAMHKALEGIQQALFNYIHFFK